MAIGDSYKYLSKNRLSYIITAIFGTLDLHTHIRLKPVLNFLRDYMKNKFYYNILEVGCGSGINAFELSKIKDNFDYVGFDINSESIKIAKNLSKKLGLEGKLKFYCADVTSYDFKNLGFFDIVLMIDFIEHIENPENILKKLKDRIKGGSIFIVSVPTPNYPKWFGKVFHNSIGHLRDGYTFLELKQLFQGIGYKLVTYRYSTGLIPSIGCAIYYRNIFKNKYLNFVKSLLLYPFKYLDFEFLNSDKFSSSLFAVFQVKE